MSEVVEYDQLVAFLKHASLFEIFRVSHAIQNELENPQRIFAVKEKLKEGSYVEYFEAKTQQFIRARLLKKNQKNVLVQNACDMKQWQIPYHLLKLDSREFDFRNPEKKGLHKNELSVGQWVGFTNSRNGETVVGRVQGLNQKTVSLITAQGGRWRVAYQLLYTIIEGDTDRMAGQLN
ncbi:MAG: hypothetical protein V4496_06190 [Pseudomonadota bacterium]